MQGKHYQLTQKIAQGGSAEVFRAIQSSSMGFQRTVAVKRILSKYVGNNRHEEMLIAEAKLLVALNHPNIVKVYDLGCTRGVFFLVMEFMEGCDLRTLMHWHYQRGMHVPLEIAVLVVLEICKALDYAHHKTDSSGNPLGIVHQDISPKNILISKSGQVKLSDFGIAKLTQKPHEQGIVRGKFAYMSPEQARGNRLDGRSDLFSLAMILFELLTGTRFYTSKNLQQLQTEHMEYPVQAPLCSPHIPEELEYMLVKCLSYHPQDRYADAHEFQGDLTRFLFHTLHTIPHQQLAFLLEEILKERDPRAFLPKKNTATIKHKLFQQVEA